MEGKKIKFKIRFHEILTTESPRYIAVELQLPIKMGPKIIVSTDMESSDTVIVAKYFKDLYAIKTSEMEFEVCDLVLRKRKLI